MENEIIHGDCLDGMRQIPDQFIDLTITSPPYDGLRTYNGYSFDFESIARELFRVTKPGGVVVWVVADATVNGSETGASFRQALFFKEVGFNLHDTMIWYKGTCRFPDTVRYYDAFEYVFVVSKGMPKTINLIADKKNKYGGTAVHGTSRQADGSLTRKSGHNKREVKEYGVRFNVWEIPNAGIPGNEHPATFPEKLAEDHIVSWTDPGDLVMDIFTGSGTTAKMAIANERKFIGFEISEEYVKIARSRIEFVQPVINF